MSATLMLRSWPASAFASAIGYATCDSGALVKSATKPIGPASPIRPPVSVQGFVVLVIGENVARTMIGTGESSSSPHKPAAKLSAFRRCCPRVVPLFPPTGFTGVELLNPGCGCRAPLRAQAVRMEWGGGGGGGGGWWEKEEGGGGGRAPPPKKKRKQDG